MRRDSGVLAAVTTASAVLAVVSMLAACSVPQAQPLLERDGLVWTIVEPSDGTTLSVCVAYTGYHREANDSVVQAVRTPASIEGVPLGVEFLVSRPASQGDGRVPAGVQELALASHGSGPLDAIAPSRQQPTGAYPNPMSWSYDPDSMSADVGPGSLLAKTTASGGQASVVIDEDGTGLVRGAIEEFKWIQYPYPHLRDRGEPLVWMAEIYAESTINSGRAYLVVPVWGTDNSTIRTQEGESIPVTALQENPFSLLGDSVVVETHLVRGYLVVDVLEAGEPAGSVWE